MRFSRFFAALVCGIAALTLVYWIANRGGPHKQSKVAEVILPTEGEASNTNATRHEPSQILPRSYPAATVSLTNLITRLQHGKRIPNSSLLTNLTPADEAQLLVAYHNTPLSNRTALIWTLAGIGGDETANAFIQTLREEFAGKKLVADEGGLVSNEEATMEAIVNALGLVASRSETANDFLRKGTRPEFWESIVKWQSSTGKEINGLLTSSAIQGLGMTDRQDIGELLQQLKANLPNDTTVSPLLRRSFAGDVVQAAYYLDMRRRMGNTAFYAWFLDLERDIYDSDGSYRKWTATGSGADWKQWYQNQIK